MDWFDEIRLMRLSDEDAGRLIESARKKEFDWQYVLSRFLSLEPA